MFTAVTCILAACLVLNLTAHREMALSFFKSTYDNVVLAMVLQVGASLSCWKLEVTAQFYGCAAISHTTHSMKNILPHVGIQNKIGVEHAHAARAVSINMRRPWQCFHATSLYTCMSCG